MKIRLQPEITSRILNADGSVKEEQTETGKAKVLNITVEEEA